MKTKKNVFTIIKKELLFFKNIDLSNSGFVTTLLSSNTSTKHFLSNIKRGANDLSVSKSGGAADMNP